MYLIGNSISIGLPKLAPNNSPISRVNSFTHPSISPFFSKYGFAFPLTSAGIPLDVIVDKKFPIESDYLKLLLPNMKYILIDHDGLVWSVVVQHSTDADDDNLYLTYAFIPHKHEGWWIAPSSNEEDDPDKSMLLGFLYNNPDRKAIDKFWYTQFAGRGLEWWDIGDITLVLHSKYPKPEKKEKSNGTGGRLPTKARRPTFGRTHSSSEEDG